MGIRNWFKQGLSGSLEQNPDEFVEIIVVGVSSGPLLVESLRAEGFDARGEEAFNVVSAATTKFRVLVPRKDVAAASARLTDLM